MVVIQSKDENKVDQTVGVKQWVVGGLRSGSFGGGRGCVVVKCSFNDSSGGGRDSFTSGGFSGGCRDSGDTRTETCCGGEYCFGVNVGVEVLSGGFGGGGGMLGSSFDVVLKLTVVVRRWLSGGCSGGDGAGSLSGGFGRSGGVRAECGDSDMNKSGGFGGGTGGDDGSDGVGS
ncbi:hypothetical protein TSUD_79270 [Trifolium subterraneum]|uniref:Uncharacterized protein n=1 Tax=Trifolium subterraneum TaxID=3900 RepID=A0A2Z6MS89_TRISU|nr:hypothetical protein TSUD_79270 [Trifolium subterraneum]